MKFLLDTNFLLIPGRFGTDVFDGLREFGSPELFTIGPVVRELEELASGHGRDSMDARLGLELIKKKGIRVLETSGKDADRELEEVASGKGFAVCTQDRELQKRLRSRDVTVICLRQGRMLSRV